MENQTDNFTSADLCTQAKSITDTYQLKIILTLQSIFGILAIFPNMINVTLLFRVKVFHSNLRLLFGHLSFDLMFYSITMTMKAIRRLSTASPCDLSMSYKKCVMEEWLIGIPLHNVMLALIVLYLERLYCTLLFRTYDTSKKKPYLACGLLTCTWISTLSIQFSNYFKAPNDLIVPVCEVGLYIQPKQALSITGTFVLLEILAIGLLIFVFIYNQYVQKLMIINRAYFDLSSRFQVDQNVKVNKALLPLAILHEICYLPTYTFLFSTLGNFAPFTVVTMEWMLHLTYLWRIIYACVHPMLLIFLNPNLRRGFFGVAVGRAVLWIWRCGKPPNRVKCVKESTVYVTNAHFELLAAMWNEGPESIGDGQKMKNGIDGIQVAWKKMNGKDTRGSAGSDGSAGGNIQIKLNAIRPTCV